jgi:chemotaxis protein methyltransferase CheR
MRWSGFRKIRSRVCKRIARRVMALQLNDVSDYRGYLENHPDEWQKLDELCRVSISRFYRDQRVFAFLEQSVLPALAEQALTRGERLLRFWSAGCACGEEAYTLAIIWDLSLQSRFPSLGVEILATDVNHDLIARAERACYTYSSVKNLPPVWRDGVFRRVDETYCLKADYQRRVSFECADLRNSVPGETFDLILCRNLVFTYFDSALQKAVGKRLVDALKPGGVLITGVHEVPPADLAGLEAWSQRLAIYRKVLRG